MSAKCDANFKNGTFISGLTQPRCWLTLIISSSFFRWHQMALVVSQNSNVWTFFIFTYTKYRNQIQSYVFPLKYNKNYVLK